VIRYRSFRNSDSPALARLWNRATPEQGTVRPIRVHELDTHAFGSACFDRAGLIVAERDGLLVGYVHAGFGPDDPVDAHAPLTLCTALGTISMLVVEPEPQAADVARGLILEAERYLRARGANVLYAGGQYPLNPFYWGLYSGSECSGVPATHPVFPQALADLGYEPISSTVWLTFDLAAGEPRDPRAVLIRRQTSLEVREDALPANWWENLALSEFHLTRFCLRARPEEAEIGRITAWDMNWFGRRDGKSRLGLIGVEVAASHRRKGYGRYLVSELLRWAREHAVDRIEAQTLATNLPALALYESLGFQPCDQSTVFRLPARLLDRSRRE
jgi:GNAT superfamily N-acetyltransferase